MPQQQKIPARNAKNELTKIPSAKKRKNGTKRCHGNNNNNNYVDDDDGPIANYLPVRRQIQFIIKNCPALFKKQKFVVNSEPIKVLGFKWFLQATTEKKGFLCLGLHAEPPAGGGQNEAMLKYRIQVDECTSVFHTFDRRKDLVEQTFGQIYQYTDETDGWAYDDIAKFENLLDPKKGFLRPDDSIEVWTDFTIKQSTLNHLI